MACRSRRPSAPWPLFFAPHRRPVFRALAGVEPSCRACPSVAAPGRERRAMACCSKRWVPLAGPVDGHDVGLLVGVLERLRDESGPVLLHIVTEKGKGYAPAEQAADKYHGVGQVRRRHRRAGTSRPPRRPLTPRFRRRLVKEAATIRRSLRSPPPCPREPASTFSPRPIPNAFSTSASPNSTR